jgi:hypothetical protein
VDLQEILQDDKLLRRIETTNLVLTVLVPLGTAVFFSLPLAGGVLLGAVVMTISFETMKWQLRKAFRIPGAAPGKGALFGKHYARFLVTVFVVFTVIYYQWVHPIAFLIGLSLVMVSIIGVGIQQFVVMFRRGDR